MHGFQKYANVSLWPKADIETESNSGFLNVRFGEESRHSAPNDTAPSSERPIPLPSGTR